MIWTFIFVAIAVLALILFFAAVRGPSARVVDVSALAGKTRPVDLAAFRNLTDPREEDYLREHLPAKDFRGIQRERLRAALDYVRTVSANAAVLLRLGESARRSQNPKIAAAGQDLVNSALRLRVFALLAELKLYAGILMPGIRISSTQLSDSYEQLTGMVTALGRLQDFRQTYRISAAL